MSGGYNAEGYSRMSAVHQLYEYNKSESTDVGGQGQYTDWNNLPRATRDSIEANRDAQDTQANDGYSWRNDTSFWNK